jgi:hypothetical protein
VDGNMLWHAGGTVGSGAIEQHIVAVHAVDGVVFGEGDKHVLVNCNLTVEVEVNLFICVEVVKFEID